MMPFFQADRLTGLKSVTATCISIILLIIVKINPVIILYMKRILKSPLLYNYIEPNKNVYYTSRGPIRAIKTILSYRNICL